MTKRLSVVVLVAATFAAAPVVAQEPAATPAPHGQPADLCQELLAFVKPPAPANPPATTPVDPKQQTAVSAPTGKGEEKPGGAAGGVQQNSGLSGPVSNDSKASGSGSGASGGDAAAKPADARLAANSAAKAPTPAPTTPAPPTKPSPEAVAQAEAAAAANDPAGCRASVQSMRRAGVTLPSPLLALGALDLKFFAAR